MKKLFISKFMIAITVVFCISCNEEIEKFQEEEEQTEENITPPGLEYTKDGDACLNVFYAIPADLDSVPGWHKRLSGISLHIQEFYKINMQEGGYGEKTFNLEINKANPDFIRIHYLPLLETTNISGGNMTLHVMKEVTKYHNENQLSSKNFVVYMPEYPSNKAGNMPFNGGYWRSNSQRPIDDMGFGVLSVDRTDFDISHFGKPSQTYTLTELANVIHEVGHAFWLQHHNNGIDKKWGMMGTETYSYLTNPDNIRFSASDLLRLNELEVFKKSSSEDFFNFNPWGIRGVGDVGIQGNHDAKVSYEISSGDMLIQWDFESTKKVVGFMVYIDPWGGDILADKNPIDVISEYDAVTYLASQNELVVDGNNYSVNMRIAWKDFIDRDKNHLNIKEGEVRFRVVFEGGVTLPVSSLLENKGPKPGESGPHNTTIRFHFNVQDGAPSFDNYKW